MCIFDGQVRSYLDRRAIRCGNFCPLSLAYNLLLKACWGEDLLEQPNTRIIRLKPQHNMTTRVKYKGIPTHRNRRILNLRRIRRIKHTSLILRSYNCLKVVSVEMKRMFTRIKIVDDNIDDLIFGDDEGVREFAVDGYVGGVLACCERGVEGWNFLGGVGYVVEECAVGVSLVWEREEEGTD